MPIASQASDHLKSQFHSVPLAEALRLPPDALLGVSDSAAEVLSSLGIKSVFDLAMSSVFTAAYQITDSAVNRSNPMNVLELTVTDLLDEDAGPIAVAQLPFKPIEILRAIDDAEPVKLALGVATIRDLSVYPPFRAAKDILNTVYFPERLDTFDPDSPNDLVPKTGEYPTEQVQYSTLVLDEILSSADSETATEAGSGSTEITSSEFKPIDVAVAATPDFGFKSIGLGALITMRQSWYLQGVTLGQLLHSMALAPGESTRIAVVDWSRKTSAGQTEQIGETESLSQDTSHNRSISEVTEAVATEAQEGWSKATSKSTTKQGGIGLGFSYKGFALGASGSAAKTTAEAESHATSSGSKTVGSTMLQNVSDRTHQHAHASRSRRASVVREVSQTEHEQVSTRVVTNYNHMHAMTVQYYEVLQVYRTETRISSVERVVFVPFKLLDFDNELVLRRFRGVLTDAALTPEISRALENYETIEFVPDRQVRFDDLRGSLADTRLEIRSNVSVRTRRRAETPEPGDGPVPDAPPEPPRPPRDVLDALWGRGAELIAGLLGIAPLRRGSESLFVPSDVRILDGAVESSEGRTIRLRYHRLDGSTFNDFTTSMPLSEISRISLTGSSSNHDVSANATLTLVRNGVVFPLELPTVTVRRGASETRLVSLRAAGADVNLIEHLKDSRLHYSQAVFRSLDSATITGLLSPYRMMIGEESYPLVQLAEPRPIRIVGNLLAFKIGTDVDQDPAFRKFVEDRGLDGQAPKVDLVPLSSGGIFAEAVLGRYNCAEKLDITRFWNWQDSPIPITAPEISAVQLGSRARDENLTPSAMSAPLVQITPASSLPDPTGTAAALTAIQNGSMFRDMSGLQSTVSLAAAAIKASSEGANKAGELASKNMEIVVSGGKKLSEQNPTVQGAAVEQANKEKAKAESGGGSKPAGTRGTDAATGKSSGAGSGSQNVDNAALKEIINPGPSASISTQPEGTPERSSTTNQGVPIEDWEVRASGYRLQYIEPSGAVDPSESQREEIVASGRWEPTEDRDFESLSLAQRVIKKKSFGEMLLSVSMVPKGSIGTLSLPVHAFSGDLIDFSGEFSYDPDTGLMMAAPSPVADGTGLSFSQAIQAASSGAWSVPGGQVKLQDVRQAFSSTAEIRIYNLTTALRPDFVQAIANLLGAKTTAFVESPVRVLAEVIAVAEEASERILSKKVGVGYASEPIRDTVPFFDNLLSLDSARRSTYTAYPRQ